LMVIYHAPLTLSMRGGGITNSTQMMRDKANTSHEENERFNRRPPSDLPVSLCVAAFPLCRPPPSHVPVAILVLAATLPCAGRYPRAGRHPPLCQPDCGGTSLPSCEVARLPGCTVASRPSCEAAPTLPCGRKSFKFLFFSILLTRGS
jgi:hypothetical protein